MSKGAENESDFWEKSLLRCKHMPKYVKRTQILEIDRPRTPATNSDVFPAVACFSHLQSNVDARLARGPNSDEARRLNQTFELVRQSN